MIGARMLGALALLAGCSTDPYVAQMRVDLGPCLEAARQKACGGAWLDVLSPDARACLVVRGASGVDTLRLVYDAETHALTPEAGSIEQPLSAGDLVTLEVLMLRPGVAECPAFAADDSCADHPTCMGSFGREPVTVDGDGALDVTYGGKDGAGCEPTCHPECQVEACNGVDDDCDGQIDEDFHVGEECLGVGACGVGRFECAELSGEARCSVDPLGSEEAAAPEDCNGLDDDCDGETDEAGALMEAGVIGGLCGSNVGACQAGVAKCVEGAGLCDGEVPPAAELCDGVDNDCDGQIDEDFALRVGGDDVALGRPCQGVGGCGTGRVQCAPDAAAACCSTSPECGAVGRTETCDGIDNDCDGVTDEVEDLVATGEVGAACGDDAGLCAAGLTECVLGQLRCAGEVAPTDEACDGLDNDCDGEIDERPDLALLRIVGVRCGSSVGECRVGLLECQGARLICEREVTPAQEDCDGRDNDCDGETDEAQALQEAGAIGGECGTDTGACVGGRDTCQGGRTVCEGEVVSVPETCDGVDNDCDGAIDDADDLRDAEIVGGGCGIDVGLCHFGTVSCLGGTLTCVGDVGPADEVCDLVDNDCDGDTDETDARIGGVCGSDVGECETGEISGCDGGVLTCDGATDPQATDICNGLDDDCDGDVDEDYRGGEPALGDACDNPEPNCEGVVVCTQDNQRVCCSTDADCLPEEQQDAELCDGADNDCDGQIDQGLGLGEACAGVGVCLEGVLECDGDDPTAAARCSTLEGGSEFPNAAELCDGLDNDCDGDVDETWRLGAAGVGDDCQGVGACGLPGAGQGLVECDAGLAAVRCSTDLDGSRYAGHAETCNSQDDDCDGAVDEDFGVGLPCDGVGACGAGVFECDPGDEAAALCSTDPGGNDHDVDDAVERCTGVDEDCDGQVDEGFALGQACDGDDGDLCPNGVYECSGDGSGVACGVESQLDIVELCNGVDDDCDDQIDEDYRDGGGDCGIDVGLCAFGTEVCQQGALVCEGATGPADEECDGEDNDCDGETDEGDPGGGAACGERRGECEPGVLRCQEGGLACVDGQGPVADLCDGLDNDCDGDVDEDFVEGAQALGDLCVGEECGAAWICAADGEATCCASDPVCNPDFEPEDELCDDLDNDCDGDVDEGFALGELCVGLGECPDGEFECDPADDAAVLCDTDPGGSAYELVPEVCDGKDQDCDGAVDNGFGVGVPCEGTGECPVGVVECDPADDAAVLCDTDPDGTNHEPTDEACTGVDEDCDGAVDEGFDLGDDCDGDDDDLCVNGTLTCAADGVSTECVNENPEGIVEVCNNADDDCDLEVDEATAGVGEVCGTAEGACVQGVGECSEGGQFACVGDYVGPVDELCDDADNDCDASTDEGFDLGDACDGDDDDLCINGTLTCAADGVSTECVNEDPAGVVEECNGADDDCDQVIDEDCCHNEPDFTACEDDVVDDPLSYDICIGDACISPGCGLLNEAGDCAVSGAPFGVVADPRDPPLEATDPEGNGEEVVVDAATGLTWTRSADTDNDGNLDNADRMDWDAAVQHCEALDFAGFADWRLPDRYELHTAVDLEDSSAPVFGIFDVRNRKRLWSVSVAYFEDERWTFKTNEGKTETRDPGENNDVLCVRGAPLDGAPVADPRYTVDGTLITDHWTGLMWRGEDSVDIYTQVTAAGGCDGAYGGHEDWYLPSLRELSTLIDHRHQPATDPVFNTVGDNRLNSIRWTATEYKPAQAKAWAIGFGLGRMFVENKDDNEYKVRCVRVP